MQDQQLTAVGGEANFNRLVNAEDTVGRGVEAELRVCSDYIAGGFSGTQLQPDPY